VVALGAAAWVPTAKVVRRAAHSTEHDCYQDRVRHTVDCKPVSWVDTAHRNTVASCSSIACTSLACKSGNETEERYTTVGYSRIVVSCSCLAFVRSRDSASFWYTSICSNRVAIHIRENIKYMKQM
jgi:hypothetical protein